jgi:hypothetical protein
MAPLVHVPPRLLVYRPDWVGRLADGSGFEERVGEDYEREIGLVMEGVCAACMQEGYRSAGLIKAGWFRLPGELRPRLWRGCRRGLYWLAASDIPEFLRFPLSSEWHLEVSV